MGPAPYSSGNMSLNADSTRTSDSMATPSLHHQLLPQRMNRDPMRYYTAVAILGEGSMGSVSKVKKRQETLGGSARKDFTRQSNPFGRLLACWDRCCKGEGEPKQGSRRNLLESIDSESRTSDDSIERASSSTSHSYSSMIRFGHHQDSYYALKAIHLSQARNRTLRDELKNEVEILKTLQHPVSSLQPAPTCSLTTKLALTFQKTEHCETNRNLRVQPLSLPCLRTMFRWRLVHARPVQ